MHNDWLHREVLVRMLFQRWFFIALARAMIRAIAVEQLARNALLIALVQEKLKRNAKAYRAFDVHLSKDQQELAVQIVFTVLQRLGRVEYRENSLLLGLTSEQSASKPQHGVPNSFAIAIYSDYVRYADFEPERFTLPMLRDSVGPFSEQTEASLLNAEAFQAIHAPGNASAAHCVFFMTNRESIGSVQYKADRSREDDPVTYGCIQVKIPDKHKIGDFKRPKSFLFLRATKDDEAIDIIKREVMSSDTFFSKLEENLYPERAALLFVHGYNVDFDSSICRTAQLAHDLSFKGPVIAFAWSSLGRLDKYSADENEALWAVPHFIRLLSDLKNRLIDQIFIIAHSMGGRIVADTTNEIFLTGSGPTLASLVLAAPDIDRGVFIQRHSAITSSAVRVTLYASSVDLAMHASKTVHGRPRVGDASDIVVCANVDSVDATAVGTDWLGHGYFASCVELLEDIYLCFNGGIPPRKLLTRKMCPGGHYWCFLPPPSYTPVVRKALL